MPQQKKYDIIISSLYRAKNRKGMINMKTALKIIIAIVLIAAIGTIIYVISFNNEGIAWDWTKPCYYDTLHYQCDMYFPIDDDNEQNEG